MSAKIYQFKSVSYDANLAKAKDSNHYYRGSRWAEAHIMAHFPNRRKDGTYINGPETNETIMAIKAIGIGFVIGASLFAGYWIARLVLP